MRTYPAVLLFVAFLCVANRPGLAVTTPTAPLMPQDNWRYDGLTFTGPDTTTPKRSIAIGTGGVYVGYGNPATAIEQFQENGAYLGQFGTFTYIVGIACDSAGNVYVLDRGSSTIHAFDQNGIPLRSWGGPGTGNGQFNNLASYDGTNFIAIDGNDQIYVCDPGNSRVQVFDTQGNFLRTWGVQGNLPGQFGAGNPLEILASSNGWIYVLSNTTNPPQLQIFDTQGNFVNSGTMVYSYNPCAITPDGLLATAVSQWNGSNYFLNLNWWDSSLSGGSCTPGLSGYVYPTSIAFNSRGDLYGIGSASMMASGNPNIFVCVREYSGVNNLPGRSPAIPQPVVLAVAQRNGTSWLDVNYKVADADNATVTTAALAFLNGGNTLSSVVPMSTFMEGTGANIGPGQTSNTTHRITWNMAADWSVNFAQIQVEILANDGRSPLGIHWITVPTDGVNPPIQISRKPVTDDDLLSLWFWYIATQKPGIAFSGGNVYGTTGFYNNLLLAYTTSGTSGPAMPASPVSVTTAAGRWFMCDQLGSRPISPEEITRANAGRYGFISVNQNSLVKAAATHPLVVLGWGDNSQGQITIPVGACDATAVACGYYHSLALTADMTVVAWGYNGYGECNVPAGLTGVTAIAAGYYHSLALNGDKTVVGWGYNYDGECNAPAGLSGVTAIAAGSFFSLALKSDGTVVAWGSNSGQCNVPAGLSGVTAIAAGSSFGLALKSDETVVVWNGPSVPAGLSGVKAIAAGDSHCLALESDGTVVAWGNDNNGQCDVPVGLNSVTAIAAFSNHSLALKKDGTVVAWGSNHSGESTVPAGLTGISAIAAGWAHSLVIKSH